MSFDLHAAVTALRAGYWRYRPHAEKNGTERKLDAAQALLESLPVETLALAPVQSAVAELVPVTDEHARRYRGNVLSFLALTGTPIAEALHRGIVEPVPA